MTTNTTDLSTFLDTEVYPALFDRLDSAFPEFGWTRRGGRWEATTWPAGFPVPVEHKNPGRLVVYPDRKHWVKVHGHSGLRWLDYVNHGTKPTGPDFVEAVRNLANLAMVAFPEREETEEERQRREQQEARRTALEAVTAFCQQILWSQRGEQARAYLRQARGYTDEEIRELELGLYLDAGQVRRHLEDAGHDLKAAQDAALIWPKLEGYITYPWADEMGHPLTIYGRWHEKTPPEGRPKTIALPGEGTKRSPLYFDRARAAGHKDLVLVEGVNDAALLQVRGDTRVVAAVAAQLSGLQLETLKRYRVHSVFVCGDPDGGGDQGTLANIKALESAGITSYVVPRLPDGLDPDEFVIRDGIDTWKAWVDRADRGTVFRGLSFLEGITPTSPDHAKRQAVANVANYLERDLRGEWSKVDADEIITATAERTGWTPEALEEVFHAAEERGRHEAVERDLAALLLEAEAKRKQGTDALKVAGDLAEGLNRLRVRTVDAPPTFSVDRLLEETWKTPVGRKAGWPAVDDMDVSFNGGELAILGARTGHCKTTVIVGLLLHWLDEGRHELLVFYSAEEPEVRIFHRLVAALSAKQQDIGWSATEVRDYLRDPLSRGREYGWPGTDEDVHAVVDLVRRYEDRLLVVHRPAWNVDELAAHAMDLAQRRKLGAVVVDYLQRIPPPPGRYDRRDLEVSTIGRRLKALAEVVAAPVVAAAQINRESVPNGYRDKLAKCKSYQDAIDVIKSARPDLNHLREGGSEQEADLVLGLLNYAADYKTEVENASTLPDITKFEVGTLKNRYGAVGRWADLGLVARSGLLQDRSSWSR